MRGWELTWLWHLRRLLLPRCWAVGHVPVLVELDALVVGGEVHSNYYRACDRCGVTL